MTPTDTFYKIKRTLLIFVGALLLAEFAGFKLSSDDQRITFLPFQLERPELLGGILFALVIFFLFQFSLQWAAQHADVQVNKFHRFDFISTAAIGSVAILLYAGSIAAPYVQNALSAAGSRANLLYDYALLLGSLVGAVTGLLGAIALSKYAIILGRKIKATIASEDFALSKLIEKGIWELDFDPSRHDATKQITFLPDGAIGLGKNKNESRWRIKDGFLEILDSEDRPYSRFAFVPKKQTFIHTNDFDTRSIRSQTIGRMYGSEMEN